MGNTCSLCSADSEAEISFYKELYVPESIKPKGFPILQDSSESEYDSLPALLLPIISGRSSVLASPILTDNYDDDRSNLLTTDVTPIKPKILNRINKFNI